MKNSELAQVVQCVMENKEENFELLSSVICEIIYYLSFKILGNNQDAEDATQETLLYIYNHLEEIKFPEAFNQWMNRVVIGSCHRISQKPNRVREKLNVENLEKYMIDDIKIIPDKNVIVKEKNQIILKVIETLPEKQKEVILLYYYQNMTAIEISKTLGCGLPAIKNRLFTARKTIKIKLEEIQGRGKEKLFTVGAIFPVLGALLKEDAKEVYTSEIANKLGVWVKQNTRRVQKSKPYVKALRGIGAALILLLVSGSLIAFYRTYTERSVLVDSEIYLETITIPTQKGKERKEPLEIKILKNTPKDMSQNNKDIESEMLEDIRETKGSTDKKAEIVMNQAYVLEDFGNLEYEEAINGKERGQSLYSKEEVKVLSNNTYHSVRMEASEIISPKVGDEYSIRRLIIICAISIVFLVVLQLKAVRNKIMKLGGIHEN